jgi:uncharacterized protein (DUF2147 family)
MIKSISLILILATLIYAQNPITGIWQAKKNNAKIEISDHNGKRLGKLKSTDNKEVIIDTVLIKDLKKVGDLWEGQIFSIERDSWYDVELKAEGDVLELVVSVAFLSKTLKWKKLK